MKEEEKKKNYRIMPDYSTGTLDEWNAFHPYSMCSAYIKIHFIHKLSLDKRKLKRENRMR